MTNGCHPEKFQPGNKIPPVAEPEVQPVEDGAASDDAGHETDKQVHAALNDQHESRG